MKPLPFVSIAAAALFTGICLTGCRSVPPETGPGLTGAWHGKVQATTGALTGYQGLEFMYAFNAGGTLTESSNFDGSPPMPPAYGVWRQTGPRQYECRYEFFATKPPARFDEIAKGGGWAPDGHGILTEKITLGEDGQAFTSAIRYEIYDQQGKLTDAGGVATGRAERIKF
jgi:hypothetical protein